MQKFQRFFFDKEQIKIEFFSTGKIKLNSKKYTFMQCQHYFHALFFFLPAKKTKVIQQFLKQNLGGGGENFGCFFGVPFRVHNESEKETLRKISDLRMSKN